MATATLGVLLLIGVGWLATQDPGISGEWRLVAIELDGEPLNFGTDHATLKIATLGYWAFDGCNSWGGRQCRQRAMAPSNAPARCSVASPRSTS